LRGTVVPIHDGAMDRERLLTLTRDFLDAFNRDDLDAVMSFFAEDGVYDEFHGKTNRGLEAIRAAFAPQFAGAYGEIRFHEENVSVDAEQGEVWVTWRCVVGGANGRPPAAWRGLDFLRFAGDRIVLKSTYAKAKAPAFTPF
jgi:ketosteroid isomerase-like protein